MKRVQFLDTKMEAYSKSLRKLGVRFLWKNKIKSLSGTGSCMSIYKNPKEKIEILVKYYGVYTWYGREYAFIYKQGESEQESHRFCLFGGTLFTENYANTAYNCARTLEWSLKEIKKAETLKIGQRQTFYEHEVTQTFYDNMFDDVGHSETVSSVEYILKCVGFDQKTGAKVYTFLRDYISEMDTKFIIVDE